LTAEKFNAARANAAFLRACSIPQRGKTRFSVMAFGLFMPARAAADSPSPVHFQGAAMAIGKRAMVVAAVALAGWTTITAAAEPAIPTIPATPPTPAAPAAPAPAADDLTLRQAVYLQTSQPASAAEGPPEKPLQQALNNLGIKSGDIKVYGFIEGSYTAAFNPPPGNLLAGRIFDIDNEEILLNQLDLSLEKSLDAGQLAKDHRWGIGGKVELIYGSDARFTHSNGLNFYGGASPQLSPENQFDLVQGYVDIGLPIGKGLVLRAGKFVTLLGYETINPTTNPFYSHSYLFGYAIPFTHTGMLAMYNVTDKLTLTGGFSRGWEQALNDNNGQLDYLGQVKYVLNDKLTTYFNFSTGPQEASDNAWRTVLDGVVTYQATDALSFAVNGDLGLEPLAGAAGSSAQWYGVALYSGYKFCDQITANLRGEWIADPQGARGLGANEYEATVGLAIKPFPHDNLGQNLLIRPELRYDYSENAIFDGGNRFDQWTAAVDAIFTF
jgi:hypothetical protein